MEMRRWVPRSVTMVGDVVGHPEPFHHILRPFVGVSGVGYHLIEPSLEKAKSSEAEAASVA